ncbi:MAG: hypothetical protein EA425_16145 [Puniceicoccaceae bacterium]|nr:MAG: hypothetical protein EA425_16145 [Puniceicoccaceae bacterium]
MILLVLSLGLNVVAAVLLFQNRSGGETPLQPPSDHLDRSLPGEQPLLDAGDEAFFEKVEGLAYFSRFPWKGTDDEELVEMVTHLRALGFPDEVVRALVERVIELRSAEALAELARRQEAGEINRHDAMIARSEQVRSNRTKLESIMGAVDAGWSELERRHHEQSWGSIAPERVTLVSDLMQRYHVKRLIAERDGESPALSMHLDQQMLEELSGLLTEPERLEFIYRQTMPGRQLAQALEGVEVSDDELWQLVDHQQRLHEQRMGLHADNPDLRFDILLAQRDLLGEERMDVLLQRTDPHFTRFFEELGSSGEASAGAHRVDLWLAHSALTQELQALRRSAGADPARLAEATRASGLVEQAHRLMTDFGGEDFWERYRESGYAATLRWYLQVADGADPRSRSGPPR